MAVVSESIFCTVNRMLLEIAMLKALRVRSQREARPCLWKGDPCYSDRAWLACILLDRSSAGSRELGDFLGFLSQVLKVETGFLLLLVIKKKKM